MRLAQLLGPDLKASLENDPEELREALEEFHAEDIAELIDELPEEESIALMRALPDDYAADVFEHLDDESRTSIIEHMDTDEAASLLTEVQPDDRVDAIQELPDELAEKILARIEETEPEVAEETRELVRYPEDSAGGLMTPAFVGLSPETKAWEAIEEVRRRASEVEALTYVYAVAFGGKLVGVCSLRQLILADPSQALSEIMVENVVRVSPSADQEEVARTIAKYDLSAIPVADETGVMLGIVTVDDVVDVVIEEATEDAQKMGAVQPIEDGYFAAELLTLVKKRAVWLVVLFLGELLTANVMKHYEGALAATMDLVLFVPLIISSGGNSGSQSSSLIIRALALGEARPRDWVRVLWRELASGVLLGMVLSAVGFVRAFLIGPTRFTWAIPLTIAGSLVLVVLTGCVVGSLTPLLLQRVGLDPAVSSTPFIASLCDVLGLAVYFTVASVVMGALL